ncbi:GntR family transcriptional regulator [Streptococcus sp. DD12]|uniref:GntR family transcriptional regulator n=1 Tax=Streptococcus sp. DD12 TaxID=1777880 RepID=UPI0007983DD9|nr:GntR family transcriptional regulator [Streptococcus sp. DD12]KXT76202.1 Transcriptional regulator, GntR family [Streptococcus sp. DD12]
MTWTFDTNKPIYLQIVERLKLEIVAQELAAGDKLPSVRDLAQTAGVNPNTIQRALSELENQKLVYSRRTSGRFVTEDQELIDLLRQELSQTILQSFVDRMTQLGHKEQELPQLLSRYIKEAHHDTTDI